MSTASKNDPTIAATALKSGWTERAIESMSVSITRATVLILVWTANPTERQQQVGTIFPTVWTGKGIASIANSTVRVIAQIVAWTTKGIGLTEEWITGASEQNGARVSDRVDHDDAAR